MKWGNPVLILCGFLLISACAISGALDRHYFEKNDYLIADSSALPLALRGSIRRMNHEDPSSTSPTLLILAMMTAPPDEKGIAEFIYPNGSNRTEKIRTQYFYKSRAAELSDLDTLKTDELVICFGQDNISPPLSRLNAQRTSWFMSRIRNVNREAGEISFENGRSCSWRRMRLPLQATSQ